MKQFRKVTYVHPILFHKQDLFDLERLLKQDSNKSHVKITLSHGDTFITATSFEQLFNEALPNHTDDLEIVFLSDYDQEEKEGNNVVLTIRITSVRYSIFSENESWFLGKGEQLRKFMQKRKPWYSIINAVMRSRSLVLIPFIVNIILLVLLFSDFRTVAVNLVVPVTLASFLFGLFALFYFRDAFPYVRINFYDKEPKRVDKDTIVVVIELLLLVIALVALILQFQSRNP